MTLGARVNEQISVPDDIDVEQPSAARVYDYYLGGVHNFAADRKVAEQAIVAHPDIPLMAHANRAFLRREGLWLGAAGVRPVHDLRSRIHPAGRGHQNPHTSAPATPAAPERSLDRPSSPASATARSKSCSAMPNGSSCSSSWPRAMSG